jgi:hypothetical protein
MPSATSRPNHRDRQQNCCVSSRTQLWFTNSDTDCEASLWELVPLWATFQNKTHPREVQVTDKAKCQLWKCELVVWFSGFSRHLYFKGCFSFPQHAVKVCTEILEVHTFSIPRVPESSSGESYRNWQASNFMGGTCLVYSKLQEDVHQSKLWNKGRDLYQAT